MIAFGVFTTHAIACYVAIDIAWTQYIHKRVEKSSRKLLWEYVLRTSIVFLTCQYTWLNPSISLFPQQMIILTFLSFWTVILAVAIPNLDLFISLVGALSLSALGILIPAMVDTVANWKTTSGFAKAVMIFKNIIIGCIGLAGFTIGTTLSLKDIIATYL